MTAVRYRMAPRRPSGPPGDTTKLVEAAIRRRGTQPFTGREIGAEVGRCRQSVYKAIRKLCERGHRIEGDPYLGFMAQMVEPAE